MLPTQKKESNNIATDKVAQLKLDPAFWGVLYPYIADDNITDVDFNGQDLWLTDIKNTRTKIENHGISKDFINSFSARVGNHVSKPFNKMNNLLEAETETLRISILHESAAISGRSICVRKSLPRVRLTSKDMIESGYCDRSILNLMVNCIKAKMNVVVGGEVGAGKTEAAKFITQFIPNHQRVMTIEDSPEWHYKKINPLHDCVEIRINKEFDYADAIKTCLRQNPKWIMLSEARSTEVKYLIESWSTGVNGVTTIHTDTIRNIASRLLNMMPTREDADRLEEDIYDFVNLIFIVRRKELLDGTAKRYIDELGFLFHDENNKKSIIQLVKNGKIISNELPENIQFKLMRADIENPFECAEIDQLIGNTYHHMHLTKGSNFPEEKKNIEPYANDIELPPLEEVVTNWENQKPKMEKPKPIIKKTIMQK